jgi:hypothetical protein
MPIGRSAFPGWGRFRVRVDWTEERLFRGGCLSEGVWTRVFGVSGGLPHADREIGVPGVGRRFRVRVDWTGERLFRGGCLSEGLWTRVFGVSGGQPHADREIGVPGVGTFSGAGGLD